MARILAITNMYPPHHYGGYELSCRDVMERFSAGGHEIAVLTTTMRVPGVAGGADERERGIRRDLRFYWDDHVLLSPSVWHRARIERRNQRSLRAALDEFRPDVVSVWNMGAMSLGLLTSLARRAVPIVYNVCDDWLDYGRQLDAWSRLFRRRAGLGALVGGLVRVPTQLPDVGKTGAFCFVSERTRRAAQERTPWRFDRSTVVYSGIDTTDFPIVAATSTEEWSWRILFVGRLDERKGSEILIRVLPLLPPQATVELLGGGDAAELDRLRAMAQGLGVADRVSFGACDRAELAPRYSAADVFVFPSTWDEPFGLVPVEAMACATPVVATGRGGSAEFLVHELNCLLFAAADVDELAAALHRLAGDPGLRRRLVDGGRATATELTIDRLAGVLEPWHAWAAAGFAGAQPDDRPVPPVAVC